jgi:multidrug transporter EmrE-like cation transporter
MVNIGALLIGMLFGFAAQTMTFFQLQGSLKYDWFKNHYWLTVLMGIPISMLFMYSVKNMVIAFDGQLWPSRLIGFSIGAIVFTWLSWAIFNEPLTTKTYVCLTLALGILMIQLFWK